MSNHIDNRNHYRQLEIDNYKTKIMALNNQLVDAKSKITDLTLQQQYLNMKFIQKQQTYSDKVMVKQNIGSVLNIEATAYIASCLGCTGITKTGINVRNSTPKIIAVDPMVIPLHKEVKLIVDGKDWGSYMTEDVGGDIQGFRIDILMPTVEQALRFGRKTVTLKIVK